ncbi:hypothetical protein AAIH33_31150, partial [Pseudomonas aeruginosa]|uniref:hypothetical protein n=1 Tax=Pseudomonas aeruginosa TaxID=287 RepID=UPI0031B683F1
NLIVGLQIDQSGVQIILTFLYHPTTATNQAEIYCAPKRRTVMSAMDFKKTRTSIFPVMPLRR